MHIPSEWMNPDRKVSFPFILQHGNGLLEGMKQKVFGEFVGKLDNRSGLISIDGKIWNREAGIDFQKINTISLEDVLGIVPSKLGEWGAESDFLSAEEIVFHKFLHEGGEHSAFLAFIEALQMSGIRYYSPSKDFDEFLQNRILPMKRHIGVPLTADTLQKVCIEATETLIAQADGIQRIKNKTYCLAGVRVNFVCVADGISDTKSRFFLLPYVFVSDGMDPGAIGMMEKFLIETGELPFGRISNVDYYSMDLHDTSSTVRRVLDTMNFIGYKEHPICSNIIKEVSHPEHIELNEIRKFAHAEQRALDRLAIMLPDFITAIAKDSSIKSDIVVTGLNLNMLVNNDSCCRCDATIKGATEKQGWLERSLIASVHKSLAFLDIPNKKIALSPAGLHITAVVSSVAPYNTGMDLNGMHFLSRGGIMREVMRKRGNSFEKKDPAVDEVSKRVPVLKIYK